MFGFNNSKTLRLISLTCICIYQPGAAEKHLDWMNKWKAGKKGKALLICTVTFNKQTVTDIR